MDSIINYDEIAKHKKKTQSNTSKSKSKAKHKHQYKSCLIKYSLSFQDCIHVSIASYCSICGKIGENIDKNRSMVEPTDIGGKHYRRMLSSHEILEKNKDLPVFDVGGYGSKYVTLSDEQNE